MLDTYMIDALALMVARPKGILDASEGIRIVDFIEIKEIESETGFNRFCDLTGLDSIHLSRADISELAARRAKFNPNNIHVKSAFLAKDPLSFGIARMYERLLCSERIEPRVFSKLEDAADWLGVKPDKLKF
jgi:hypothetical protein